MSMEVNQQKINEIVLNELNGQNDWHELSLLPFSQEQLYKFKDQIQWEIALKINNENITEKLIDKLLDENSILYTDERKKYINRKISKMLSKRVFDYNLIKKHIKKLGLSNVLDNNKLKISQVAELINNKPEVGMGATISAGSDCYPYTIIDVNKTGTKIKVQRDNYEPAEGYDYYDNQVYNYSSNPNGCIYEVSLRKDGKWKIVNGTSNVRIGHRSHYSDPSF